MDGTFLQQLKGVLDAANTAAMLLPPSQREPSNVYYLRDQASGQFQRIESLPPIPRITFGNLGELLAFLLSPSAAALNAPRPATVWVNPAGAVAKGIGHALGIAECAFTPHPTFQAIVGLCDVDGIPIEALLRSLDGALSGVFTNGPVATLSVVRKMSKSGFATRSTSGESPGSSLLAEVEAGSAPTSFKFATPVIREIPELVREITLRAVYGFGEDGPRCWLSAVDPDTLTKWGGPGEVLDAIRANVEFVSAPVPAAERPIIVPACFQSADTAMYPWQP